MKSFTRTSIALGALLSVLTLAAPAGAAIPGAGRHDLLVLRMGDGFNASLMAMPAGSELPSHSLPLGLFDRSGRTLYFATPQNDGSIVEAIDAASGRTLRSLTVSGYFSTMNGDYSAAALAGSVWGGRASQQAPYHAAPHAGVPAPARHAPRGGIPVDPSETLSALSFNGRWLALRDATPGAADTSIIVIDTAAMDIVPGGGVKGGAVAAASRVWTAA